MTRAAATVAYPARFALVGATNPCPCGRSGELDARPAADAPGRVDLSCRCAESEIARYRGRLSGPLADRIDMHVHIGRVPLDRLADAAPAECSAAVRQRVERARMIQRERYAGMCTVRANAQAPGRWLDVRGGLSADGRALLRQAAEQMALSARGFHRVMRVARTIADLAESADAGSAVTAGDVAEALRYRPVITGR